jgi:hypothetical protein
MASNHIKNLEKNRQLLTCLCDCKKSFRNSIISEADKSLIDSICQIVYNVLHGHIQLDDEVKTKLQKYKKTLRKLVEKNSLEKKKKIIIQNGGWLQFILPAAITAIGQIISSFIPSTQSNQE